MYYYKTLIALAGLKPLIKPIFRKWTMSRITAADILKVVPITRKTLWLWQKKYRFFPDPQKEGHPGGKGIVGYYPAWVEERCKQVYIPYP